VSSRESFRRPRLPVVVRAHVRVLDAFFFFFFFFFFFLVCDDTK
jgi:hypothetical protein